ncbi:hypothetical protein [Brucella melitensis]|uniref:hypothetical protein n=1 Tax=Brucella melitensis TaxID=29459 RepID=UPI0009B796E6
MLTGSDAAPDNCAKTIFDASFRKVDGFSKQDYSSGLTGRLSERSRKGLGALSGGLPVATYWASCGLKR